MVSFQHLYQLVIIKQGKIISYSTIQCKIIITSACREVVERRAHIVTGKKPTEAEIDNMIDTGESETIFQKAILEQGRGHVSLLPCPLMPCGIQLCSCG